MKDFRRKNCYIFLLYTHIEVVISHYCGNSKQKPISFWETLSYTALLQFRPYNHADFCPQIQLSETPNRVWLSPTFLEIQNIDVVYQSP